MKITLTPRLVALILTAVIVVLLGAHFVGLLLIFRFDIHNGFGFIPMTQLNAERNVPTFFCAGLMAFAGLLFGLIGYARKDMGRDKYYWGALGLLMLFFAVDELIMIHERLNEPMKRLLQLEGYYWFVWVVPYVVLALILFFAFFGFFKNLPARTRNLLILGAVVFVAGAIGIEVLSGVYLELAVKAHTFNEVYYEIASGFEEIFEMAGLVIVVYALLAFITTEFGEIGLHVASTKTTDQAIVSVRRR
ncbi:MAG: hypothetical protein KC425_21750 [Anaerolineales bacterium]|nr:hypothetical protein [Anaerolineales bacterium]